jgi:cyclohexyl-isocyanide hydratase
MHIIAKSAAPVPSDSGLGLMPTHTFADCPRLVVKDGNVITAGGVTAGIDFGIRVAAEIAGEAVAQAIQLSLEYNPDPPFDAGHPDRAPAAIKDAVFPQYEKARAAFRDGLADASMI